MKTNFEKIAESDLKSHLESILCLRQLRKLLNGSPFIFFLMKTPEMSKELHPFLSGFSEFI